MFLSPLSSPWSPKLQPRLRTNRASRTVSALFTEGPDPQGWRGSRASLGGALLEVGAPRPLSWVGPDQRPQVHTLGLPRTAQQRVAL